MKKLIVLSAAVALAGCGQRAETVAEATPTATTTTMAEAPSPVANQPATGNMAGVYEVKLADGTVVTQTIKADGTYTDLSKGEETTGRWRSQGTQTCFDPDGAAPEVCSTASTPGPDGSFMVMGTDGTHQATVRKIGAAPAN